MLSILAEGLSFPEGPVVLPDGSVVLVEMAAGLITRVWGEGRKEVVARPGGGPNGAQLGPDGALYVCNNGGTDWVARCSMDGPEGIGRIERIDLSTGEVERLYDHCDDKPLRAPNDLVVDEHGGIWFTDMGKSLVNAIERSAVHYCQADGGGIVAPFRGALSYNGIGLSPDGRTLYVAETQSGRIWRFTVTAPGALAAGEDGVVKPEFFGGGAGPARFDSLAITASGAVCVATMQTPGITTLRTDGSQSFEPMPDPMPTNIAFGGEGLGTAYITLAGKGMLGRMAWPEAGLPLHFGYRG